MQVPRAGSQVAPFWHWHFLAQSSPKEPLLQAGMGEGRSLQNLALSLPMDLSHAEWPLGSHIFPTELLRMCQALRLCSRSFRPRRAGGQQARKQMSKYK